MHSEIMNKKHVRWEWSLKLTWTWIMHVLPFPLAEMLAEMSSMLCFSSTETMLVMSPGLWTEQMENWASFPRMLRTMFEAAQVLSKDTFCFPETETAPEVVPIICFRACCSLSCFFLSSFSRVSCRPFM